MIKGFRRLQLNAESEYHNSRDMHELNSGSYSILELL